MSKGKERAVSPDERMEDVGSIGSIGAGAGVEGEMEQVLVSLDAAGLLRC